MATPSRKLQELSLFGYKSIRELKNLRLDPGLNVLIGANGSGKTNFIKFFELLGHMMDPSKGLQNYVNQRGRADAFLFRGPKVTPKLRADFKFGVHRYDFILHAADDHSLYIAVDLAKDDQQGHTAVGMLESVFQRTRAPDEYRWVADTIQDWRVYHFHDTTASARVMGLCNIVDNRVLHSDAANLSAFLWRIQQVQPDHYTRIVEAIRQVAPFFGSFVHQEVSPGQTQLLWKDRHCDLTYYAHQLSDGTLRFICLAALLLQPEPASTLIIDEPELGLHPFAIKLLASMLLECAAHTQLIVSTQSSQLLDELTPEQIIVANHRDGETLLERLDPERLREWLTEYTLGQLWEKNELGGSP